MTTNDEERPFRIHPEKVRGGQGNESRAWSTAFQQIVRIARMSSRRRAGVARASHAFRQRCAVRLTYSANRTSGQWRAHGRYIERESAAGRSGGAPAGFDQRGATDDVAARLAEWQLAGDPRLFKLIVSPEFGSRMDLQAHTREVLARMERDLGTRLEWVAVIHRNTEHHHAHIALRGIREDGSELRLERKYVQHRIREHAEDIATRQLGFRSPADISQARRAEVERPAFTSLDRGILSAAGGEENGYRPVILPATAREELRLRLHYLRRSGLAETADSNLWWVRADLATVLRAMQTAGDRQRALAAHLLVMSDPRLRLVVTDPRRIQKLEGRVIGHGEDEASGRSYLLLEGTDHQVHFMFQTAAVESARAAGQLRVDRFARFIRSEGRLAVEDLGSSESILHRRDLLRDVARGIRARGGTPSEEGWGGWLGRYDRAVVEAARDLESSRSKGSAERNSGPAR